MEKKWKLTPNQTCDLVLWMVMDGRRPLAVQRVNYDGTEGVSLGETAVIHWRIGSVRILSPPPLFLAVSHWQHSIFLWTLSNFALALHPALSPTHTHKHSVTHTHTHTYTSYLTLSFPVRHLAITATTTASHSRFLWSHVLSIPAPSSLSVLHPTPPYLTLSATVCPPSHLTGALQSVRYPLWEMSVRYWSLSARLPPYDRSTPVIPPSSRSSSVLFCHPWSTQVCCELTCGCWIVLIKTSNSWIMFPTKQQNKTETRSSADLLLLPHPGLYSFQMRQQTLA